MRPNTIARVLVLVLIGATGLVTLLSAQSSDRARAEALARRATDRIRELQREAEALAHEEGPLLTELRRFELERQIKAEELTRLETELDITTRQLTGTTVQIEALEKTAAAERPEIEARMVDLYKMGRGGYVRMLLHVANLRGLAQAYRMVATLVELDRQRIEEHKQTLQALRTEREKLEQRQRMDERLRAEVRTAREALDRAVRANTALVRSIDDRRDLNAQLTGELQQAQQRLQAAMGSMASDPQAVIPVALPLRAFRATLEWPAHGAVTLPFGRHKTTPSGARIVHNGIEISAPEGELVRAVHDGRVAYADAFTGFGNLVIVDHGEQAYSLYGYLSSIAAQRGRDIAGGELVGAVGRAPAGAAALYFELRIDGQPVDPLKWLKR
ncbi:MAG: peptidoglycan DD-metalloendopeptidase family protein [Acidobacteria bacterium]|nr:peptidoglycan DD-metalloendopeptidase family protein [Acidobacteriota bacterium]